MNITVIGCGWLGLPLCESLIAAGHKVITTTTNPSKIQQYKKKLNIRLFDIKAEAPDQDLLSSEVIIYMIPPLGENEVEHFFHAADPDQKIIFISSTAVYGKSQGPVDEESDFFPESPHGIRLLASESYLRVHFKNLTILRPGGLTGLDRHPVYFLQGKKGLTNGNEYLHLVDREDCIHAILEIIEKQVWSQSFNLVNDTRVLKKDFYTKEAMRLGLTPPQYQEVKMENPTNISNLKSKRVLSLNYLKNDLQLGSA